MFMSPQTAVQVQVSLGTYFFSPTGRYLDGTTYESIQVFLVCPICAKGENRQAPNCGGCGRFVPWSVLVVRKVSAYFDPDEYEAEVDCPHCETLMPVGVR